MKRLTANFQLLPNDEVRFDCSADNQSTHEDMVCMFLEALDTFLQVGGAVTLERAMNRIKPPMLESALQSLASSRSKSSQPVTAAASGPETAR